MAGLFDDNFSFDSPRSPSIGSSSAATRDSSRSVSPCSSAIPFPPPRLSITDLATQFADQRLRKESRICYDSCEAYANNDGDEMGWSIPSIDDENCAPLARSRTHPQRPHSPSRRTQRQLNTRLLCSKTHRRDIAALVTRMVESSEQCSISPTTPVAAHDDEGYSSESEERSMTSRRSSVATIKSRPEFRRSSEYKSGGTCVTKNVRLRKKSDGHRRIKTPR